LFFFFGKLLFKTAAKLVLKEMATLTASNKKLNKKKILLTIVSVLLLLLGVVAMISGAVFMYLNTTNDSEGYALSNTYTVQTSANAFVLWVGSPTTNAQLKWIITSPNSKEVFAGFGQADTVVSYVGQYKFATPAYGWNYIARAYSASLNITNVDVMNQDKPAMPSTQQPIYLNQVTTTNKTTLYCSSSSDNSMSMLVIMNTDGSNGVNATIQLGSKLAIYSWLPYALIPVGLVFLAAGFLLFKRLRK
jgi:hypothetical protein